MRKTVTITVAGALFHIEEAAYAKLDAYLDSVRAHFASYKDADEIVSDIESRIAEEFSDKLKGRKKVISEQDVDALIQRMGTVKDFEEFDAADKEKEPSSRKEFFTANRRLFRDTDDQMIGGVASGIAKYFGIDPTVIRLLFAASVLLGGTGVIIYVILWIVLPEAKTPADKVEMTQGNVTLSAIQQKIDAAVPPEKRRTMLRKIALFPGLLIRNIVSFIGKILRFVLPLLARIIGVAIALAATAAIAGVTVVMLMLITNPQSPYIDFPFYETLGAVNYFLLVLSGYFLAFVPLIFVLLIGASLLSLRGLFTTLGTAALVGLWFVALTVGTATGFSVAPAVQTAVELHEQEHFVRMEKTFDLKNFDGIVADRNTRITVTRGDTFSVKGSAVGDDWPYVDVRVEDNRLLITQKERVRHCLFFCRSFGLTMEVTMPDLKNVTIEDISHADIRGFEKGHLELTAHDSSHIEARVQPDTIAVNIHDVSHMELIGGATSLDAELSDVSSLGAYTFPVETATVDVSDISRAMINASKSITGTASDHSRIFYKQMPAELTVETSDIANVEQRDEDEEENW
jgi:phage shock protein PspC (stress-responsive transcriptional regulator)